MTNAIKALMRAAKTAHTASSTTETRGSKMLAAYVKEYPGGGKDFAKAIGWEDYKVSRVCKGRTRPSLFDAEVLAVSAGIPMDAWRTAEEGAVLGALPKPTEEPPTPKSVWQAMFDRWDSDERFIRSEESRASGAFRFTLGLLRHAVGTALHALREVIEHLKDTTT